MAQEDGQHASTRKATAPSPEDPRKPDELSDITKPSWRYVAAKTLREYSADQATDLAAALTYYGVLALFPALLAVVSIIGLVGDAEKVSSDLLDLLGGLVPGSVLDGLREPIENLASSPAAGFALITGIVGAIWSASGYVGAFSRAMNRIYSIQEGRSVWKLRPVTLAVTVLAVIAAVVIAALLALSGEVAETVADVLGIGDAGLLVWNIAKWPIVAFLAVLVIAVLYYATPNVKQPRFRWFSLGSVVALVTLMLASLAFAFYVANFSSYNETYGSIGGVIVFLLWVWIGNNALLFGAELNAELERGRELQAGIAAEEHIQLPPRDTKASDKKARAHEKDVAQGRALRAQVDPDSVATEHHAEDKAARKAEREAKREKAAAESDGTLIKVGAMALRATAIQQSRQIMKAEKRKKRG